MKQINCNQKGSIYIFKYQNAGDLNPKLHDKIWRHACHKNNGSRVTDWFVDFEEFHPIKQFAWDCFNSIATKKCPYGGVPELVSLYGRLYDKGEYLQKHSHFPCHWSFIYYVNTPWLSSPTIFGSTRVAAKSGNFILFPSWAEHRISKNWSNNRSTVSGDFYYRIK